MRGEYKSYNNNYNSRKRYDKPYKKYNTSDSKKSYKKKVYKKRPEEVVKEKSFTYSSSNKKNKNILKISIIFKSPNISEIEKMKKVYKCMNYNILKKYAPEQIKKGRENGEKRENQKTNK